MTHEYYFQRYITFFVGFARQTVSIYNIWIGYSILSVLERLVSTKLFYKK